MRLIISPEHFAYLVIQHGSVSDERHSFPGWKDAYEQSLLRLYDNIAPVLPDKCGYFLDVGSGLGGIDIHLARHYKDKASAVLLDGTNCPPVVEQHAEPFSNMRVADDFLRRNGVKQFGFMPAGQLKPLDKHKFDLVVSFAAYGFHIPPQNYLSELLRAVHDKTVVILDIRRARPEWLKLFVMAFGEPKVLFRAEKFVRCAFRV